jgi:hypothetical protein
MCAAGVMASCGESAGQSVALAFEHTLNETAVVWPLNDRRREVIREEPKRKQSRRRDRCA